MASSACAKERFKPQPSPGGRLEQEPTRSAGKWARKFLTRDHLCAHTHTRVHMDVHARMLVCIPVHAHPCASTCISSLLRPAGTTSCPRGRSPFEDTNPWGFGHVSSAHCKSHVCSPSCPGCLSGTVPGPRLVPKHACQAALLSAGAQRWGRIQPGSAFPSSEEPLPAPEIATQMMLSAAGDDDAKCSLSSRNN